MITLHQFEDSPFCDKVRRVLHFKRVPYQVREVPPSQALLVIRKINPRGKLPCLEHDGVFVSDSTDIAHYLEAKFPTPALLPTRPRDRALCHVLEDWADESLYFQELFFRFALPHNARRFLPQLTRHDPGFMQPISRNVAESLFKRTLRAQGTGRKPMESVEQDLARHLTALSDLLEERAWLVGDALCLADIAVFTQLACICVTGEGTRALAAQPKVAAWMGRVDRSTQKQDA